MNEHDMILLNKVNPPWKVHSPSFFLSLSKISFQETCVMVDLARGAPKYFEGSSHSENPRILRIFHFVIFGVLKKYTWDFSLFISRSLASRKASNPSFIPLAS